MVLIQSRIANSIIGQGISHLRGFTLAGDCALLRRSRAAVLYYILCIAAHQLYYLSKNYRYYKYVVYALGLKFFYQETVMSILQMIDLYILKLSNLLDRD